MTPFYHSQFVPEPLFEEFTGTIPGAKLLVTLKHTLCTLGTCRGSFKSGKCYSLHGVYPLWQGVGDAWMISDGSILGKNPITAFRSAKEVLTYAFEKYKLNRIQMDVDTDFHMKWCETMGFTLECIMKKYSPDGTDKARFSIVK